MARARSISAKPKRRGPGRPATGRDPMIGLRLPKDEIARLDAWAKVNSCTRSEAIRMLIERGIDATDHVARQARRIAELEALVAQLLEAP